MRTGSKVARKKLPALVIDVLLILVPGFIWMFVFGRANGFMVDPPDAASFRRLCLEVVFCIGIFYLLTYVTVQVSLLRKTSRTIGKWIMG